MMIDNDKDLCNEDNEDKSVEMMVLIKRTTS